MNIHQTKYPHLTMCSSSFLFMLLQVSSCVFSGANSSSSISLSAWFNQLPTSPSCPGNEVSSLCLHSLYCDSTLVYLVRVSTYSSSVSVTCRTFLRFLSMITWTDLRIRSCSTWNAINCCDDKEGESVVGYRQGDTKSYVCMLKRLAKSSLSSTIFVAF